MIPGRTLAHIHQLTSTDQVSYGQSSVLEALGEKAKVLPLSSRFFHVIGKTGKASVSQLENKEALRTTDVVGRKEELGCVAGSGKSSWMSWHLSYSYSNLRVF